MGSVAGTKGIVDVGIGVARKSSGKVLSVLLLFLVEAEILQQTDRSSRKTLNQALGFHAVASKDDLLTQLGTQVIGHRLERQLGALLSVRIFALLHQLGTTHVRDENDSAASLPDGLNRGQSLDDARVVGDDAVLHWDIEIDANEDGLGLGLEDIEDVALARGAFGHGRDEGHGAVVGL